MNIFQKQKGRARLRVLAGLSGFSVGVSLLAAGIGSGQSYPRTIIKADPGVEKAYSEGLSWWRRPDSQGRFCAGCHTPDGMELAAFNFDDDTLRRRAKPHVGDDGAQHIVDFIHAVRKKYGITKLLDPMTDRPLQPGGEVLPGKTPQERDLAFAEELKSALPTLADGDVNSPASAEQAKKELLDLDARSLQVGIPFNRISEDGFHGKEHASFADWISDTVVGVHFSWEALFVLQDRYLQDPSEVNLLEILNLTIFAPRRAAYLNDSQLMTGLKARSLLLYQHMLRKSAEHQQAFGDNGPVVFGNLPPKMEPNPLLELGEFADARSDTPFTEFRFPSDVLDKKLEGPGQAVQMGQIRLPSLYAGWLMDQGLQRSDRCPEDRATRIVTERLLSDGPYPMLDAFLITKKLVTEGFVPEAWGRAGGQRFAIDFSSFLGDDNLKKFEPAGPERDIYRRFVVNAFIMSLYLYRADVAAHGPAESGDHSAGQIGAMRDYVKEAAPGRLGEFDAALATSKGE